MSTPGSVAQRYFYVVGHDPTSRTQSVWTCVIFDRRTGERICRCSIDNAERFCALLNAVEAGRRAS